MSTWLPPIMPPAVEELWLPTGHSDTSIDAYAISCLELTLQKRREDMRTMSAPVPVGLASGGFRNAGEFAGEEIRGEEGDEDEDMEHERDDDDLEEELDDMASDEFSDDAELSIMEGSERGGGQLDPYDGSEDETDDDDDDDDDLAGYL